MKIVFDMDGVLKQLDLGLLKSCTITKDYDPILIHRKSMGHPLLNPALISLPSDELFVLTNCSSENAANEKKRWIKHFYGDRLKFMWVSINTSAWGKGYVDPVARVKLDKLYDTDADAYFDDDPAIIRVMRELNNLDLNHERATRAHPLRKRIAFFKWGPWIEEVYEEW